MNIQIIESRAIWDQFLAKARPNTFLHSWEWGEFNSAMGESIWRLGVYAEKHGTSRLDISQNNAELVGIALIVKVQARRGSFLLCPHGAILKIQEYKNIKIVIGALVDYLKPLAREENCGFIRFSPLMLNTPENNQLWHELGFREAPTHMHPELSWILNIAPSENELLTAMRKTTRYSIRKAEKDGVKIVYSTDLNDLEKFWQIQDITVKRQHFVPFPKRYLREEFKIFTAQNCALFIFGMYHGEVIASAFIIFQPWSAFYHHGASNPKYANIPASQLVQWHAIKQAKQRGCAKYNFWGIVPENATSHPWHGLSQFKRGFGGFAEEYAHAKDLKISQKYWITYIVETIRRIKRGL